MKTIPITIITETGMIIPRQIPANDIEKMRTIYNLLNCELVQIVNTYECQATYMLCDEEYLMKIEPVENVLASMLTGLTIFGHVCIIERGYFR